MAAWWSLRSSQHHQETTMSKFYPGLYFSLFFGLIAYKGFLLAGL
jgi:hypothetical protein